MWTKFCLLLFNNEREKVIRERDKCILVFLSDPGLMSFLTFREVTKITYQYYARVNIAI